MNNRLYYIIIYKYPIYIESNSYRYYNMLLPLLWLNL